VVQLLQTLESERVTHIWLPDKEVHPTLGMITCQIAATGTISNPVRRLDTDDGTAPPHLLHPASGEHAHRTAVIRHVHYTKTGRMKHEVIQI
jgi:hypothetical protein